jgi:hypothetical protein
VRNFVTTSSFWRWMKRRTGFRGLHSGRLRRALPAVLLCIVAAATPGVALGAVRTASPVQQIFDQCASGHLSGSYTVGQLQQALSVMPATVSQYTSCPDVVQTAIVDTRHHRGASGAIDAHGAFLPLPLVAIVAALVAAAGVLGVMALRRR